MKKKYTKNEKNGKHVNKPVFRNGKSESYFDIDDGGWGILYGCELDTDPAGKDSPDELLTTPLFKKTITWKERFNPICKVNFI